MYKSAISENVKKLMREHCLRQGGIAKRAGYDGKTFSNMMNGRKIITDVDVMRIANALSVEPNDLYGISKPDKEPEKEVV